MLTLAKLSFSLWAPSCKHRRYWVTNNTNRCWVSFQVLKCSIETLHHASLNKFVRLNFLMLCCTYFTQLSYELAIFECRWPKLCFSAAQFQVKLELEELKRQCKSENRKSYLSLLQSVVLILGAFGASRGARRGMKSEWGKLLALPLPLWKISAFSARLPEVCISSTVLLIALMWAS